MNADYRPPAWYRRTPDTFSENVRVAPDVEPIDVAKTLCDLVRRTQPQHRSAAVWVENKLLAAVMYEEGGLFVRIVSTMRDHIALPWRAYGTE